MMRDDRKEGKLATYIFYEKKYLKTKVVQFSGAIRTDRPRMFTEYSLLDSPT